MNGFRSKWCQPCSTKQYTQLSDQHKQCPRCQGYFCRWHLGEHDCPKPLREAILGALRPR